MLLVVGAMMFIALLEAVALTFSCTDADKFDLIDSEKSIQSNFFNSDNEGFLSINDCNLSDVRSMIGGLN